MRKSPRTSVSSTAAIGYIYYWNHNVVPTSSGPVDDQEVYFSVARDFGFANASLTYFWDIDGGQRRLLRSSPFSRSFELNPCLALNVAPASATSSKQGEFTAWTTKVGLDWGFAENAKLSPFVALSVAAQ